MPEASRTITIARPVGDVFAFLADAENDKKWRHGVIEITRTGGQGVGTTYRQVVSGPGGRPTDADVEITEFVPDHRIAFRTTKGPVRPTGSYDLRAGDGGTELTFRLAAKLGGLKKLMSPMVSRAMNSEVAALVELKRVLEDH
ncbi:MAG TPA: SRPBCC family protein [Acidimicrobiales bacterium]|nr:SRPBCC family protein [Acidimicrobiales bacterium]